ncbi:MAG: hypothetical protein ACRDIX_07275 [Actinomycetota bacterium]
MKAFPGCNRRVYLWLPRGRKIHLRKSEKVSTGPVTWCGWLGGTAVGWRSAKRHELCSTCAHLSGVAGRMAEVSA